MNDIKGELYRATAGYRATLGPVYVIDPVAGVGHRYDPFAGRTTERQLATLAHHLLFDPQDREPIFVQRAEKMLTQMTRAARMAKAPDGSGHSGLLPYVGSLITGGPKYTAEHLQQVSPELASKFLSGEFAEATFTDDKFFLSCWGTLDTRLWPLLTDEVIACLSGSDFTPETLMTGTRPATVYVRMPEGELKALSPLTRLLFGSFIDGLSATYDRKAGAGCRPVLILADEAGRSAIPMLADAATTVLGRRIYLWIAVQSLASLELVYGRTRSQVLRDSIETQLFFRPTDETTANYLSNRLGRRSDYAHSSSSREGASESKGPDFSVVLFRPHFMLASEDYPMKVHKNQWLSAPLSSPDLPCGATNQGTHPGVWDAAAFPDT